MNRAARTTRLAAALPLLLAGAAGAERIAFTNAVLHPIAGPAVEGGTLLVEDAAIVAVEPGAPPADAGWTVVDLEGRHVWPGLIDAGSDLGLVEVDSVRGTADKREVGDFNPDLSAAVAFHADSRRVLPAIGGGVLAVHVVPDGELFAGRSAAMRLDGWNWEGMTIAAPVGQHLRFPRIVPRRGGWNPDTDEEKFEQERDEKLRRLDEQIGAARGYARARSAMERGDAPAIDIDPRYEALRPLLAGEEPLFLWADERMQIGEALDWVEEQELARVVLVSSADAAHWAERLAAAGIPVILNGVHRLPARAWEPYDAPFTAAAQLDAAGVALAFADGGSSENARNLPFQVATAVGYGLPRVAAHRALTLGAAEILGIAEEIGSLEPGKEASFFVADGDPLDIRTRIERVFVRGEEVDLSRDPQRQLWQRYRERPASTGR
jgi:imidazolonepropionase-like amidohydrolase